jgi:hypothetical protein
MSKTGVVFYFYLMEKMQEKSESERISSDLSKFHRGKSMQCVTQIRIISSLQALLQYCSYLSKNHFVKKSDFIMENGILRYNFNSDLTDRQQLQ